jgi:hypothetical protein
VISLLKLTTFISLYALCYCIFFWHFNLRVRVLCKMFHISLYETLFGTMQVSLLKRLLLWPILPIIDIVLIIDFENEKTKIINLKTMTVHEPNKAV